MDKQHIMKAPVLIAAITLVSATPVFAGGIAASTSSSSIDLSAAAQHSASDFDSQSLTNQGYTVSNSSTGDDTPWRISYQRRIRQNLFVDVGYADLGKTDTNLNIVAPAGKTADQVADDVYAAQARRGAGVTLGLLYKKPMGYLKNTDLVLGAGAYNWKDKNTIQINGVNYDRSSSNTDAYARLGANFAIAPRVTINAGYDHYFMPKDGVDQFMLGLGFKF